MTKQMTVTVDLKVARQMLEIAGYFKAPQMSDEEVFNLAMSMNEKYGVKYTPLVIQNKEKESPNHYSDDFLLHRLDEIEGQLKDWHISAHKCDLLYKEKDAIIEELTNRGHFSKQSL